MAEWSNAAVLKTVDLHGSGGSNPSSSAKKKGANWRLFLFYPNILFADIDLIDLGLLAGSAGEEVLSGDDGSALIALDLIYPELHC